MSAFPFDADDRLPPRHAKFSPSPKLVPLGPDELTAEDMVEAQYTAALHRMQEDTSKYPRFPWESLHNIAGPMAPGEFWIVCARTGHGKTMFFLNLFDALIEQGRCGLYIGLEQTPDEMRIKWACTRAGVPQLGALGGKWPVLWGDVRIQDAREKVNRELARQRSRDIRHLAHFSEARFLNARGLKTATEWAVDHGAEFVVIDHLNRIQRDEKVSSFDGHSQVVSMAKELAVSEKIVMLAASQVGRPNGDPVQRFTPPALHELRGGGTSEEEANTVLAAYRPLKAGVTNADMTMVRQGLAEESAIYEADVMTVRILKHRLAGMQKVQQVPLMVEHGKILEPSVCNDRGGYDV